MLGIQSARAPGAIPGPSLLWGESVAERRGGDLAAAGRRRRGLARLELLHDGLERGPRRAHALERQPGERRAGERQLLGERLGVRVHEQEPGDETLLAPARLDHLQRALAARGVV